MKPEANTVGFSSTIITSASGFSSSKGSVLMLYKLLMGLCLFSLIFLVVTTAIEYTTPQIPTTPPHVIQPEDPKNTTIPETTPKNDTNQSPETTPKNDTNQSPEKPPEKELTIDQMLKEEKELLLEYCPKIKYVDIYNMSQKSHMCSSGIAAYIIDRGTKSVQDLMVCPRMYQFSEIQIRISIAHELMHLTLIHCKNFRANSSTETRHEELATLYSHVRSGLETFSYPPGSYYNKYTNLTNSMTKKEREEYILKILKSEEYILKND